MTYYAKTDGTTLEEHVNHLLEQKQEYGPYRTFVQQKYAEMTGRDLFKMLHRSIVWHDEGKKDPKWQEACLKGNLRRVGVRHELVSLCRMHKAGVKASPPVRAAVAAHHGKLGRKHEDRWRERPEFEDLKLWNQFLQLGDKAENFEQAIRQRYEYDGPRALLQLMDHRASAKEGKDDLPTYSSFAYTFPWSGRERGVQIKVKELWDEPFAILRAPTGSGKTDAALLWAQHQIEQSRADRLIVAMPTRFTANALAVSVVENLSSRGLYHSTSRFSYTDDQDLTDPQRRMEDKEQELARLLETPVTITTVDHLCICLTATREDHHGIFFNLAHSCVVIDEADFYDDFSQHNIVMLLQALRLLHVPVLMMSATVPESARSLYSMSGFDVPPIYEDRSDNSRIRCWLTRFGKVTRPHDVDLLLKRALTGEPTIIYANTVRRAQEYYRWFEQQNDEFARKNVVLYHSRFTEPHKVRKEKRLYDMLGKDAWKGKTAHGVAILTQIGELSVNISADFMLAELCPIDRLTQRVGRLARFGNAAGTLFVLDPFQINRNGNEELYPAPYGVLSPGQGWVMTEAFAKSDELLKDGEYTAQDFVDLVNQLYPDKPIQLSALIRDNRAALERCILNNWLLLPKETVADDEDSTKDWRSRNIPPQQTIYVGYKISGVDGVGDIAPDTWLKFREFQLRYGIQCHTYEFKNAVRDGLLIEARDKTVFTFGEDHDEPIWVVPKQYYDFELGLHLSDDD